MNDYIDKWERALQFLIRSKHDIGMTDGVNIIIDGKPCLVVELPDLAERLHQDEWLASEKAFLDSILKRKSATGAQ